MLKAAPTDSAMWASRWQRYLRQHPRAVDLAIAAAPIVLSYPGVTVSIDGSPVPSHWPGYVLATAASVALLWVRRYPKSSLTAVVVITIAMAGIDYTLTPLLLAPVMVAVFFTALLVDPKSAVFYTVGTLFAIVTAAVAASPPRVATTLETIGISAWLILPVPLGIMARNRAARTAAIAQRAEYAEQTREEEARRRVGEERMRIARDLHDVLAHHLAVANAQAGAAAHLLHTDSEKAEELLAALTETTSSTLRELKGAVGLLRHDNDADSPLQPVPGLDQLLVLADSVRAAGLEVTLTFAGEKVALSPTVDLTAYRIIQEALTNAAKHATGNIASVEVTFEETIVRITVTNPALRSPMLDSEPTGYGLIGMRERAHAVGGEFRVGQSSDGTFWITANLPVAPREHIQQSQ